MQQPLAAAGRVRPIAAAAGEQDREQAEDGEMEGPGHGGAANMIGALKHGLPPVVRADARLLVLGSLPGEASLQAGRYYAHPRNQFWRLMEGVAGEPLEGLNYGERLERLVERRIALWDVIHAARRSGSLDGAMREIEARDLTGFVAGLPELRAVAFNGGTAARLGRKALAGSSLALIDLPSSSPAYTLPFAEKARRWNALAGFLD
ncbi:DNA-deoxyinosine glycosylase [Sphingomonas glaciei]|uniref:DNA-deoxyinosine glycosylase n=1 Tax=Sphingomonas glaciei TaxID=2938948 RepID=A0ABY5MUA7_9SPHN|nr:DNA-deoxyinosine glycosylase [Sphingomonas glaciei]UUR08075.1 DNA-deoxyinosine glycosylase [Sphingomonas glaciei]